MTEENHEAFTVNGRLANIAGVAARYCDLKLAANPDECIMAHMLGVDEQNVLSVLPLVVPGEMIDEAREAIFEQCLGTRFVRMVFFCEAWLRSVSAEEAATLSADDTLVGDPRTVEAVVFDGRDAEGNRIKCHRRIDRDAGAVGDPVWVKPENSRYLPSTSVARRQW